MPSPILCKSPDLHGQYTDQRKLPTNREEITRESSSTTEPQRTAAPAASSAAARRQGRDSSDNKENSKHDGTDGTHGALGITAAAAPAAEGVDEVAVEDDDKASTASRRRFGGFSFSLQRSKRRASSPVSLPSHHERIKSWEAAMPWTR